MSKNLELALRYLKQESYLGLECSPYDIKVSELFPSNIQISNKNKADTVFTSFALKEAIFVADTYNAKNYGVIMINDGEFIYPVIEIIFKSEDEGADI